MPFGGPMHPYMHTPLWDLHAQPQNPQDMRACPKKGTPQGEAAAPLRPLEKYVFSCVEFNDFMATP